MRFVVASVVVLRLPEVQFHPQENEEKVNACADHRGKLNEHLRGNSHDGEGCDARVFLIRSATGFPILIGGAVCMNAGGRVTLRLL